MTALLSVQYAKALPASDLQHPALFQGAIFEDTREHVNHAWPNLQSRKQAELPVTPALTLRAFVKDQIH